MFKIVPEYLVSVILENRDGQCNRVKVWAHSDDEALAKVQMSRPGRHVVGVEHPVQTEAA